MTIYRFLAICIALISSSAHAFYPVDGWWWNSSEPGRDFNIEMQDDVMFISGFIYAANGEQLWFTSSGRYNATTRRIDATLDVSTGGQCIGCRYTPPNTQVGALGPLSIQFSSAVSGTLNWSGGSVPITRFWWAFGEPLDLLYGRFGMVMSSGLNGDRVDLRTPFTGSDGTRYVAGNRTGSSGNNNLALAEFRDDTVYLLLDSTASFYRLWQFDLTKDRWEGRFWLFDKNALPSGAGTPFHGFRIASRSFVQTGVGPSANDADAEKAVTSRPVSTELVDQALHVELSNPATADQAPADLITQYQRMRVALGERPKAN